MPQAIRSSLHAGIAATVGAMLGACNLLTPPTGISASTPPVHDDKDPFTGAADYTGKVMVFGEEPKAERTVSARFPANLTGARVATVSHDVKGLFQFENLKEGPYQFITEPPFSTGSAAAYAVQHAKEVDAGTKNYLELAVTDPLARPKVGKDHKTPGFMWEVGWKPQPSPAVGATVTGSAAAFAFTAYSANDVMKGPFEYQIFVESKAATTSAHPTKWQWSSPYRNATSFTWNGKEGSETDSAAGTAFPAGAARYMIKFRTAGVTDGSKAYGQSHWVVLTLQ